MCYLFARFLIILKQGHISVPNVSANQIARLSFNCKLFLFFLILFILLLVFLCLMPLNET